MTILSEPGFAGWVGFIGLFHPAFCLPAMPAGVLAVRRCLLVV